MTVYLTSDLIYDVMQGFIAIADNKDILVFEQDVRMEIHHAFSPMDGGYLVRVLMLRLCFEEEDVKLLNESTFTGQQQLDWWRVNN